MGNRFNYYFELNDLIEFKEIATKIEGLKVIDELEVLTQKKIELLSRDPHKEPAVKQR